MAKVFIEESTLTKIGNSIRNKTGKTDLIDPAVMDIEIDSIVSGGGEIPEEAFKITGNCAQRFSSNCWNWFIDTFGSRVTTENITKLFQMCTNSDELTRIPFTLNINDCYDAANVFKNCNRLEECPKIRGNFTWSTSSSIASILDSCHRLADAEDLFDSAMLDGFSSVKVVSSYSLPKAAVMFSYCHSLRSVPSWFYKLKLNEESTATPSATSCLYYSVFSNCSALDEALNIQVWRCIAPMTSNMFSSSFNNTCRLKNFTFETQEDGTPYEVKWKSQTIDLSSNVGWANSPSYVTSYNS
jgi:hypothetical protein